MFFGLDIEKLILIAVVAALVAGPERLPRLAQSFARFVVRARSWANEAKSRVKEEMGDDLDEIEWRKLDPRQYDPRRIVRDALLADPPRPAVSPTRQAAASVPTVTDATAAPAATDADTAPRPEADDAPGTAVPTVS